ncbi:mandelate racemase/muconate lactonizing enzyme family protein [Paenibacillus koleovorans]|uniref:mandelate racemase/muconate lactonizing enzyme family protein n=1 Tax=Paenibacillus koleovorans TaxID=121608 RepID=UPI000FDC8605|nr:mandelate racemase/muconate lactonizing enzyme family protein [Paenibacillus koleovorans]
METIQNVTARQIVVPLENPVWLGGYAVKQREYCLVELTTDHGAKGYALAFTRGANLADIVVSLLAPLLMNQPVGQIERLWETMYYGVRLNGRQGALMRALSLVDIALWDLKSTQWNVPLHRVLGGYRDSVPVMMAGGYYSAEKGIQELCKEFLDYVDQGYKHLKLVVGGASMEEDLARFIAVRNQLPAGIQLGVDANGAWDDPKAVLRWIERADRETTGLSFVEEPLPPEQRAGLAWLRQASSTPLAVGEFIAGRWMFLEYMKEGCMDIVRADATLCGGISEWRKIAALANAWNLPVIPHYFAPLHIHLALALPGCSLIEVVSTAGRNSSFHLIAGRSYELKDGEAVPTNAPGLGYVLDPDFIEAHTTQVMSV